MKMHVAERWRYPVKSLAGELLDSVEISAGGIPGDRVVQVHDAEGRIVTARTAPRLLGLTATLGPMNEPLVDGRPWTPPLDMANG
jgi:MOSC domain-containing protein